MSPRSPYRDRGSPKRLRQIRMDPRSVRRLWMLGVATLLVLLWVLTRLSEYLAAH